MFSEILTQISILRPIPLPSICSSLLSLLPSAYSPHTLAKRTFDFSLFFSLIFFYEGECHSRDVSMGPLLVYCYCYLTSLNSLLLYFTTAKATSLTLLYILPASSIYLCLERSHVYSMPLGVNSWPLTRPVRIANRDAVSRYTKLHETWTSKIQCRHSVLLAAVAVRTLIT